MRSPLPFGFVFVCPLACSLVAQTSQKPPDVMHWCAAHCSTWTLDKGAPFDKPHYGSEASGSIVIVERFTPESVIMQRTDFRPYPGKALLTGKLSPDGSSIAGGTIQWTFHPCCGLSTGKFQAAWGPSLDTVPGSDAERERAAQPQPVRDRTSETPFTGKVDLNGRWSTPTFVNNAGQKIAVGFTIVQKDENLTMLLNQSGKPNLVMFEGHFNAPTRWKGRARGPSNSDDNPNWTADTLIVLDATHIKFASGAMTLVKTGTAGSVRAEARIPAPQAASYLRAKPFDLNGTWQGTIPQARLFRLVIVQNDGDLTMRYASVSGPFFRGRYEKNPRIPGRGIASNSDLKNPTWVERNIFVDDPDHIRYNADDRSFVLFRISNPAPRDLACDAGNSDHVARYFALVRGRIANSGHDLASAKCWIAIAAGQNYAPAESALAALLLQQPDATEADYDRAFQLAGRSAAQGDIAGQLELASLYREGKGIAKDPAQAQLWTQRARQSKAAAQWKLWNSTVFLGLTPLDVAGLALKATNAVIADVDESARRYSCANGQTADCRPR